MTNEDFIKDCVTYLPVNALDHARKLVALFEFNQKCFKRMAELGLDEENDFDDLMEAILILEQE